MVMRPVIEDYGLHDRGSCNSTLLLQEISCALWDSAEQVINKRSNACRVCDVEGSCGYAAFNVSLKSFLWD